MENNNLIMNSEAPNLLSVQLCQQSLQQIISHHDSSMKKNLFQLTVYEPNLPHSHTARYIPWTNQTIENTPNLLLPSNDTSASDTVSKYQIVSFKGDRLVLYDPDNHRVGVKILCLSEQQCIRAHQMSACPMCGQSIDVEGYSFEAQSYFRILQNIVINKFNAETSFTNTFKRANNNDLNWSLASENIDRKSFEANPFIDITEDEFPEHEIPKNLPPGLFITGYYRNFFCQIESLGDSIKELLSLYRQRDVRSEILSDQSSQGEYAVKKVPVGDNREWLQKMLREVRIRECLHNTNIVQYKHSWLEMYRPSNMMPVIPWLFVLMEYCNGGDLEQYLKSQNYIITDNLTQAITAMPENHIWKLFNDIAKGLNHLHHNGILHRDLKPQNILLQCTLDTLVGRPTTNALLSDFGTSELISEKNERCNGFTGTVEYTAPELFEQDETGHLRLDYDEKSDIWSLGIIMYLMAYGRVPYLGADGDPKDCRSKILRHQDPKVIIPDSPNRSEDLILLIEALLQKDPNKRPSLDSILFHPKLRSQMTDKLNEDAGYEITFNISCEQTRFKRSNSQKRKEKTAETTVSPLKKLTAASSKFNVESSFI